MELNGSLSSDTLKIQNASGTGVLVIQGDGVVYANGAGAVATNTAFGSVQFTGLLQKGGVTGTIEDYFTSGTGGSIGTAFNPALVIAGPYTGTIAGEDAFYTEAGFDVSFDLSLTPIIVDGIGTVDMALANVGVSASFVPVGATLNIIDKTSQYYLEENTSIGATAGTANTLIVTVSYADIS